MVYSGIRLAGEGMSDECPAAAAARPPTADEAEGVDGNVVEEGGMTGGWAGGRADGDGSMNPMDLIFLFISSRKVVMEEMSGAPSYRTYGNPFTNKIMSGTYWIGTIVDRDICAMAGYFSIFVIANWHPFMTEGSCLKSFMNDWQWGH